MNLRGSITVQLICLFCLDSAAILMMNQYQLYLLGSIKTIQTGGGHPYSDTAYHLSLSRRALWCSYHQTPGTTQVVIPQIGFALTDSTKMHHCHLYQLVWFELMKQPKKIHGPNDCSSVLPLCIHHRQQSHLGIPQREFQLSLPNTCDEEKNFEKVG